MSCSVPLRLNKNINHGRPAFATVALVLLAVPAGAADSHPWCMLYQDMTGATACYYDSYEQCGATAAGGNGGVCAQNPAYREPQAPASPTTHKPRRPR